MWESLKIEEKIRITDMYTLFDDHFENTYSFPGETHDFWECLYVIRGKVCVSGNERVYNMSENEMVFHKPLELHKFYVDSEDGAELLIFSFSAVGELLEFFKNKVVRLTNEQNEIMESFRSFLDAHNDYYSKKRNNRKYLMNESPIYLQMITTYINQLLLSIYDDNLSTKVSNSPDAKIFKKAVKYMEMNLAKNLSISNVSDYCNVSPTGLKRVFFKYSGLGVHKYYVMMKINKAAKLLKAGKSVTEISEKLNFSSQGYFSSVFKREKGISATDYVKSLREEKAEVR